MTTEIGFIQFETNNGTTLAGSVKEAKHKDWSAIYSFNQGVVRPVATTSGRQTGFKANLTDMTITKGYDKSSTQLFLYATQGVVFSKVRIEQVTSIGGTTADVVFKATLSNATITSYNWVAEQSPTGVLPTESIAISFSKIEMEYVQVLTDGKPGGKSKGSWNVVSGQPN